MAEIKHKQDVGEEVPKTEFIAFDFHEFSGLVESTPPSGFLLVTNIYLKDEDGELVLITGGE